MSAHSSISFNSDAEIAAIGCGVIELTLPKARWTHAAHFAAALWLISCRRDLDAARAMPGFIRAYNQATGVANTDTDGYHETITQASLRAARSFLLQDPERSLFMTCNALMASPLGKSDWLFGYWSRALLVFRRSPARLGGARPEALAVSRKKPAVRCRTIQFSLPQTEAATPSTFWIAPHRGLRRPQL